MKKVICLMLVLCLFLTACGAQSVDTTPSTTASTTAASTEAPTEAPTEEPTKPEIVYTPYTLGENEVYEEVIQRMGFCEVAPDLYESHEAFFERTGSCKATGLSLTENGFRMELFTTGLGGLSFKFEETPDWVLYGAKGDGLADITDFHQKNYKYFTESSQKEYWPKDGYCQFTEYAHYSLNDNGDINRLGNIFAIYYPDTGNLYNLVREYSGIRTMSTSSSHPGIFIESDWDDIAFESSVYTVQHEEYEVPMSKFVLRWGRKWSICEYRPGMSLIGWACSELNTTGWIPWYDNSIRSPDGKYFIEWADRPIEEIAAEGPIAALRYNGYPDWYWQIDFTLQDGTVLPNFDAPSPMIQRNNMEAWLADWGVTEEEAKTGNGTTLIPFPVAYTVNAYTPLITEGFRTMSKVDGRVRYHMLELNGFFILDDVIDVYMNNISNEVLPHIKLYVFPEPQEVFDALGGRSIMDVDMRELHLGADWLKIPENAVYLDFQRCSNGSDAPNSPHPFHASHGENPNYNAVYARYTVAEDPNVDPDSEYLDLGYVDLPMAMAVTYDEEIVYWIHLGSRTFNDPENFTRVNPEARY